mgnify:CR=1 FL=1
MIARTLTAKIIALAQKFQVITLTGPRQSGKTTLVRAAFPTMPYASLEEPDMRQIALTDPRGFLANYPAGAILDEIQHTPDLLSYIQSLVDQDRQVQFILTGSSNFLLMEKISQTLAGRTAVLHLLPFSLAELKPDAERLESVIFQGQYPRIYDRDMAPTDFYPAYIQTYIERDVRLLKNIGDYNAFIQFTRLCAGRVGQLLNYASLASDAVSQSWAFRTGATSRDLEFVGRGGWYDWPFALHLNFCSRCSLRKPISLCRLPILSRRSLLARRARHRHRATKEIVVRRIR